MVALTDEIINQISTGGSIYAELVVTIINVSRTILVCKTLQNRVSSVIGYKVRMLSVIVIINLSGLSIITIDLIILYD